MKKITLTATLVSITFICCFFTACTTEKGSPGYNDYPEDVGKIIFTKCATPGCHTEASKDAAGGLSLVSWDKLFEGGTGSACVIPYRSDYSTLCYYINTFSDLGVTLVPTMPYNKEHLSRDEVMTFKNWIDAGAPSKEAVVKFSDNPHRKKFYVVNQGCDVVTVFDEATLLPMRYINVGNSPSTESPHMIRVSPDGQYWYVIFLAGSYFEKYRTSDDSFVARVSIGPLYWNSFFISDDSRTAYCIDFSSTGHIATIDLTSMIATVGSGDGFTFPHGCSLNNSQDTLYVTGQQSSQLYKFPVADFGSFQTIDLAPSTPSLNSHEIRFSPDGSKYFVTCQGTSEVRVFNTATDALITAIPVGAMPSEMVFSSSTNYLFVTCTEDTLTNPGKRGTVAVIDYTTNALVKKIYTGHQPHGIDVDDAKKLVYVANANYTSGGPAPHHASSCGGRNGNVSFIDLNTLEMVTQGTSTLKQIEVSVYPYAVAIRH